MKLFNFRRKKETLQESRKITAGGQITAASSTLILTQPQRFNLDLSIYKAAIRAAENMDYTRRSRLYDMYADAMLDAHMIGVINKRRSALLKRPVEFWRNGVPDETVNVQIRSPWFRSFLSDVLDAQFYGFTLAQFTTGKDGYVEYFCVPRKHVDPQLRLIKRYQSDITGVPFDEYPGLIMITGDMPLGLLASCLPWTIRKNGTVGDWCQFSELFGMPIRDYAYDAADEDARRRTLLDAMAQGSGSVFIHPDGTKLNFIEAGNKTGSADVYQKLVDVCNKEMSKAILGNTLTTEASETGTQALGTVHQEEEEGLAESDRTFVLNALNYLMTDIFSSMGIDTEGGEFVFVKGDSMTKQEKAELFSLARNQLGLPIDDDYIYQELGIERPADYDRLKKGAKQKARTVEETLLQPKRKIAANRAEGFFVTAPEYGALKW